MNDSLRQSLKAKHNSKQAVEPPPECLVDKAFGADYSEAYVVNLVKYVLPLLILYCRCFSTCA